MDGVQRNLNLTIRPNERGFEMGIHEPESGEVAQLVLPYNCDEIGTKIKNELFSWISLWAEEEGISFPGKW